MSNPTLKEAAQEVLDYWQQVTWGDAVMVDKMDTLRTSLEQDQDLELSAALGWPGGISDPVLDRKTLLQQVARLAVEQAQAAPAQKPVAWIDPKHLEWLAQSPDNLTGAGLSSHQRSADMTPPTPRSHC